jgi:hypothetical protein
MPVRMLPALALLALPLAVGGCESSAASAPTALAGLWGVGEASCAAGRGVRFDAEAVRVVLPDGAQTLLPDAHYRLRRADGAWHIRIRYSVPGAPGARGEIMLTQGPDGWLQPKARRTADAVSGAMRLTLRDDVLGGVLRVRPCSGRWTQRDLARVLPITASQSGLRGRG